MYTLLWTSLLVAIHYDIWSASITQAQFRQMWFKITLFESHCIFALSHFKPRFPILHFRYHPHCLGINMGWKNNDTAQWKTISTKVILGILEDQTNSEWYALITELQILCKVLNWSLLALYRFVENIAWRCLMIKLKTEYINKLSMYS